MRQWYLLLLLVTLAGCQRESSLTTGTTPRSLAGARQGFQTQIVSDGEDYGPAEQPPEGVFDLVHYPAPVGELVAYVTPDPGDGRKHPAIVWITGGDNNTIGDVWSESPRENDQSARAFREAGVVMMFPSQRGGNDNPGRREGFYGEADDILAATDYLESLPYVDADQVYLGGHSTGGTMVMLVGALSDRYQAIFAFGPVANPAQYGGSYVYFDVDDEKEVALRSPLMWLDSVRSPMYVIEGATRGNWDGSIDVMEQNNTNPKVKFFKVDGYDHFSILAPATEMLAEQVAGGEIEVTQAKLDSLPASN